MCLTGRALPAPRASFCVLRVGSGIPPSEVERLKQPFTRMDTARGSAAGGKLGSGLGLAIVDRVVTLHGGEFTLLLREGGGTLARIVLPLPAMTGR